MNFAAHDFSCEIFGFVSTTLFAVSYPIFLRFSSKEKFSIKKEFKVVIAFIIIWLFGFALMCIDVLPGFIDSYHCYEKSLRFGDRAGAECLKTVRKGTYGELFKKYFLQ